MNNNMYIASIFRKLLMTYRLSILISRFSIQTVLLKTVEGGVPTVISVRKYLVKFGQ